MTWGDMDGDGYPDLAAANTIGQLDFLYRNNGDGTFTQRHEIPFTLNNGWTEGITWVDFDNDGDLDIFVASWGNSDEDNRLYQNLTTGRNWLKVRLHGVQSNSFGIGALARLGSLVEGEEKIQTRVLLPKTGYGSTNQPILHFGLGTSEDITFLEVSWPSGLVQRVEGLGINAFLMITEGQESTTHLTPKDKNNDPS